MTEPPILPVAFEHRGFHDFVVTLERGDEQATGEGESAQEAYDAALRALGVEATGEDQ